MLLAATCVLAALGAACASVGPPAPPAPEVVRQPVDCEQLEYRVVKDGATVAKGVLASAHRTIDGLPGWQFSQDYSAVPDSGFSDSSQALVADNFRPRTSTRSLDRPESSERHSGNYEAVDGRVTLTTLRRDGARESATSADLKLRANAYDNESAYWLWRTLPLAEGYRARYVSVNVLEQTQSTVDLTVVGRTEVTVPAGTFEAWRILVVSGRATRQAWIETVEPFRLLQWDNGTTFMQLERGATPGPLCEPRMARTIPR
ncbi:MAG: DUF3108 domain-containing protein [Dehalococcoidia bacterium]